MKRPTIDQRKEREKALRPLFKELKASGRSRVWLAKQLGISRKTLSNYEHGERRSPKWFVAGVCRILRVPQSRVRFDGPIENFIQPKSSRRKVAPHDSPTHDASTSSISTAPAPRRGRPPKHTTHTVSTGNGETRAASAPMDGGHTGRGMARALS